MIRTILILLFPVFAFGQQGMLLVGEAAAAPAGLLLDTYTGAAAAFATMKLRADADSCMVIRRSSDDATQLIGFSGNDIDESAISTHCSGTDCFVVRWCDQTGQGLDAVQTTAAAQPKIYDSSTGIMKEGGKTAVDFDGSDDFLLVGGVFASDVNISTFLVVQSDNTTINQYIYDNSNSLSYGGGYSARFMNSGGFRIWAQYAIRNAAGGSTTNDTQYLVSAISNNTGGETNTLYMDGSQVDTNTGATNSRDAKTETRMGHSERFGGYLNGTIQVLIAYPSDQSANRTGIETNINNYFSIY